ncbi:MAG: aminotransferase class V-fold PLP-dependent enzyme [Bacteroidetes bacterium]|jgi:glutamate/tyrosine decarboxylase-like PLP-dependent enzyme|nr:aminotransferase class V-fold PLP-dependent enzyme [Bacteroidota bacterium]
MRDIELLYDLAQRFKRLHEDADKLIEHRSPKEMMEEVDLRLGSPHQRDSMMELIAQYIKYSVKTGNKQYLNQLFSGFNETAVVGDMLAVLMNTSMYTYEVSPIATLIEREVIDKMNSYLGFVGGDGIFTTGGSNSNLMGMLCARHMKSPNMKEKGLFGSVPLTAFVSDQAHYSLEKAAYTLGIGSDYLITVKSDEHGRMLPQALETALSESMARGEIPFLVSCTSGTTELGAFDPLDAIGPIAKRHGCWFHVDGSWGGPIILSSTYRHLFRGLEWADSFVWNPHKLMNVPLSASALLVRSAQVLPQAMSANRVDYLFHDHENQQYDLGKKTLQCGRRNDALKVWLAWKELGDAQWEDRINKLMDLAQYCGQVIKEQEQLELLAPIAALNINFRYKSKRPEMDNWLNLKVRQQLLEKGISMVNYCHLDNTLSVRLVLVNLELERQDIDLFFANYMYFASQIEQTLPKPSYNNEGQHAF